MIPYISSCLATSSILRSASAGLFPLKLRDSINHQHGGWDVIKAVSDDARCMRHFKVRHLPLWRINEKNKVNFLCKNTNCFCHKIGSKFLPVRHMILNNFFFYLRTLKWKKDKRQDKTVVDLSTVIDPKRRLCSFIKFFEAF